MSSMNVNNKAISSPAELNDDKKAELNDAKKAANAGQANLTPLQRLLHPHIKRQLHKHLHRASKDLAEANKDVKQAWENLITAQHKVDSAKKHGGVDSPKEHGGVSLLRKDAEAKKRKLDAETKKRDLDLDKAKKQDLGIDKANKELLSAMQRALLPVLLADKMGTANILVPRG